MKLGAENRRNLIAAVALGVVALVLVVVEFGGWFSGPSTTDAAPVASTERVSVDPVPTRGTTGRKRGSSATKHAKSENLDPRLRFDLLKASEDTKYEGTGRNIFRVFVEPPPKPVVSPVLSQQRQVAQGPAQPPPPPPIGLKFYGFATPAGGAKRIFLAKGEDVFIAKEGDIVDRRYKVVRISPNAVDILDVLSNNRQSIPLVQG